MAEVNVTDANFDAEVIKSTIPVIVDFWAEWCGPCKMQDPILEELAKEYEGKIKLAKLNVDENPAITAKYAIMSIPTLLLFNKGQIVKHWIGVQGKDRLKEEFSKVIS